MVRHLTPILFDEETSEEPLRSFTPGSAPWFHNFGSSRDLGYILRESRNNDKASTQSLMSEIRGIEREEKEGGRGWRRGFLGSGLKKNETGRRRKNSEDGSSVGSSGSERGRKGGSKGSVASGSSGRVEGKGGRSGGGGWRACFKPVVD